MVMGQANRSDPESLEWREVSRKAHKQRMWRSPDLKDAQWLHMQGEMEGQDAAEPQAGFLAGVGAFPFCPLPTIHTSLFWKSAVMKDRDLDGY